ncbi:MAG: hypothetical protein ACFFA4_15175 [Promethearchaeota archaeon]
MVEHMIKTFKLNFDGTFDEIAYANIKEVFTIVNILAIYIQKIKTMYIWIGRNATQALKNHISQIRVLLKDEFPDFRIIRNITFDMRAEPLEFFYNLNIRKEELYKIINHQEKSVLPILEKVDALKDKSEELIKSEQYKNAINLLKEIIELAKKIQDDALATEQKRLISELTEKYENKEIVSQLEKETIKVEKEYKELISSNKVLEAHNLVKDFIEKFESIYDLSLIPSAKELILKEKRNWNSGQEKIKNNLILLEKELNSSLENLDLSKATEIFENGITLLSNLLDEKIRTKWENLNKKVQDTKEKLEFIKRFDKFSKKFPELKENHQYSELKIKIEEFSRQLDINDVPEYRSKLNLLKDETEASEQSYNNIIRDITELEKRIKNESENNQLNQIVKDCTQLIGFAQLIGKIEIAESYTKVLELTKIKIKEIEEYKEKQKELESQLLNLEKNFNLSLNSMEIDKMKAILENGSIILSEIVNNDIKKKWDDYISKFNAAKQFLEKIELLSKNAIDALDDGFCSDSLELFEQIIIHLQDYQS